MIIASMCIATKGEDLFKLAPKKIIAPSWEVLILNAPDYINKIVLIQGYLEILDVDGKMMARIYRNLDDYRNARIKSYFTLRDFDKLCNKNKETNVPWILIDGKFVTLTTKVGINNMDFDEDSLGYFCYPYRIEIFNKGMDKSIIIEDKSANWNENIKSK